MREEWRWTSLGEVCKTSSGGTPLSSRKEFYESGTIPWLVSGEVGQGDVREAKNFITAAGLANSSAKLFPPGTVLVAMYGATAGEVGILRFEAATNQAVCGILPCDHFSPEFLYYFLLAKKDDLVAQATGNAQPNISQAKIKGTEVPLLSLPEQQRIVALLDEAFAGLATAKANAERNLQNARVAYATHLQSILNAKGKEWEQATVKRIARPEKGSIRTGPFGSQLLHSEFVDAGIAVLGIDNAVDNHFRWGKSRFITPEKYEELERYTVRSGDVLITIMGTCGRCAVVPDDIPTAISTKHLCCITLDRGQCLPDYLHIYFLHAPQSQEYLAKHAKGAIMAGLNMGLIQDLPVFLPPVQIQKEIIRIASLLLEETQRLTHIYERKLAALVELKKSLLQQAFNGEL